MKNYIFVAVALVCMTACKDPQSEKMAIHQRDSLLSIMDEREASINEMIVSFNEVERNLDSVNAKQHIILMNTDKLSDSKLSQKARINAEIKAINALMEVNSKKMKQLSRKLNRSDKKNAELEKTIAILNNQLSIKYAELIELNERLNALNAQVVQLQISVDTLIDQNLSQSQVIAQKTNELHTAYYIVENSRELQRWELIDKEGGFLGIGQIAKLSNNLDKSMFTKIDYMETTSIPVNSKGIKIVTTHPTGSFSLDKTGRMVNSIMISDPEKFWSASKYLVITK